MAPRLPRLIFLLASLAAAPPGVGHAQAPAGARIIGRDVVTREMIEEAGLLRLGEVVRLAPQWNATTADDFTWRSSPRALAPGQEDAWTLLVDGRPIETAALGVSSLERLPLDLASIDSIVFVASPTLESGVFARAGLVHVYTRKPSRGFSALGRLGFGSETGDPGPFAFLPEGRQNRDRYGHESAVEAAVARGRWYAAGSYTASVHLPTDPLILLRMYASSVHTPRIERVAPALRIGVDGDAGGHYLLAGTSRIDDWMRLDLAGIEIPVRSTLSHLSVAGAVRLSRFDLGYHAGYERSRVASIPRTTAPPLDFEWRTLRGMVEASPSGGAGRRIGLTFARRTGLRFGERSLGRDTEVGAFGEVSLRSASTLRHHVVASLSSGGNGAEGGIVLTNLLRSGAGDFTLRFTASRARAMTATGLFGLAAQGDPWFDESGTAIDLPAADGMTREAGAELGWISGAGRRASVSSAVFLRAFDGALAARRDLAWDPVFRAWRGPVRVTATAGRLAGGRIGLRYRASSTVDASADLHLTEAFGESAFQRAAEPLPALRSMLSATWRPVTSFGLRGELEIESERRWPDYRATEPAPGKARPVQPGGATASLSAWKTFLDGRLRGQFAARNLTGRRIILHPEGRASALSFLFLLGAAL